MHLCLALDIQSFRVARTEVRRELGMDHTNREMTGVTLYVPSLRNGTEVALNGTGVRGSVGSVHSMPSVMMYALAGFRNLQFHERDLGYRGRWEGGGRQYEWADVLRTLVVKGYAGF
jgi:hypothetical protein